VTEFKIGDKVAVDLDVPESSWHKAEGYVIATRADADCAKVHVTKCDKTPSLVGAETTLYHLTLLPEAPVEDAVSHPSHYTRFPVEVIELTRHLPFTRGNAVKYIARAGHKDAAKEIEDLKKAIWYIQDDITQLEKAITKSE
jgi:hypothetical protein